jgi:hypothetical protein
MRSLKSVAVMNVISSFDPRSSASYALGFSPMSSVARSTSPAAGGRNGVAFLNTSLISSSQGFQLRLSRCLIDNHWRCRFQNYMDAQFVLCCLLAALFVILPAEAEHVR